MAQFFAALGYKFFVKLGTTDSEVPTGGSGMTEVLSLQNAGIQASSETQNVLDYSSELGYSAAIVTGQSYTIPMTMNLDLGDPGYHLLREASLNAAAGVTVEWFRESPIPGQAADGSGGGTAEKCAGVAFVTDFQESIEAGAVAQVSFTLTGIGKPSWEAGAGAPATP